MIAHDGDMLRWMGRLRRGTHRDGLTVGGGWLALTGDGHRGLHLGWRVEDLGCGVLGTQRLHADFLVVAGEPGARIALREGDPKRRALAAEEDEAAVGRITRLMAALDVLGAIVRRTLIVLADLQCEVEEDHLGVLDRRVGQDQHLDHVAQPIVDDLEFDAGRQVEEAGQGRRSCGAVLVLLLIGEAALEEPPGAAFGEQLDGAGAQVANADLGALGCILVRIQPEEDARLLVGPVDLGCHELVEVAEPGRICDQLLGGDGFGGHGLSCSFQ